VFSEHQVEHLSPPGGLRMLRECARVLRPDGTLRITTPDLERVVALLDDELDETRERYLDYVLAIALDELDSGRGEEALRVYVENAAGKRAYVVNRIFRAYGHQFVYDEATLRALLERVGFTNVARRSVGQSEHDALRGIERHAEAAGEAEMNRFETLVLEATKPS
jgi:SAM-dependent methyltransferase